MGSRERREARQLAEQRKAENGVSRRKFLKTFGIGLATAASGGLVYRAYREKGLDFIDRKLSDPYKEKRKGKGLEYALSKAVPLGREDPIILTEKELRKLDESLTPELEKDLALKGIPIEAVAKLEAKNALYGLPSSWPYNKQALNFCRNAENMLHDEIKGLELPRIRWSAINEGDDFSKINTPRGFITDGFYQVRALYALGKDGKELSNVKQLSFHAGGVTSPRTKDEETYLIVAANEVLLISAFSELCGSIRNLEEEAAYAKEHGYTEMLALKEAFDEGLTFILAEKMIKKYKIKTRANRVREMYEKIASANTDRYKYIANSIEWTNRNGVQAAHDLFRSGIENYAKAIKGE